MPLFRHGLVFVAALFAMGFADARLSPQMPVLDREFADPFVLPVEGGLVAYSTNVRERGRGTNVQLSLSTDGRVWSAPRDAMPARPPWALQRAPDIWAPEVMRIGDRYVLFFSARHATLRRPDGLTLCVGAASSDSPEGPFVPQAEPLTCGGPLGVIDASPFQDGEDLWLYVKTDGNCCRTPITIVAQRLAADGLSLQGQPTTIAGLGNDAPWEGRVIEAQQMVLHDGRYLMFYAANDYGGRDYATGYAVCEGPAGPCRDARENPILKSTPGLQGLVGPGHQSVFQWRDRTWIAFHGWRRPLTDGRWGYRALYISPLDWVDGRPVVAPNPAP